MLEFGQVLNGKSSTGSTGSTTYPTQFTHIEIV